MSTREEFEYLLSNIPDFIDMTSDLHNDIWEVMSGCNDMFLLLTDSRFLDKKLITKIVKKFNECMDYFSDLDNNLSFSISIYYINLLDYFLDRCLEDEEYEAAENIRLFNEIYSKKYISDEE